MNNLIKTKYGYYRFDPIPDVDYTEYYSDHPDCIKNMEEDIEWWNMIYDDRLKEFNKGNILDVGCGVGFFLNRAKQKGYEGMGIEINEYALRHAVEQFGLNVQAINMKSCDDTFDNIHCSYLLEHLPDPEGMLKECYRILRKNGIICIVVPNDFNPLQMLLKPKYGEYWIEYPWHINYFNFDSLSALMQAVGFKIKKVTTGFPMEWFALFDAPPMMTGGIKYARKVQEGRIKFDMSSTWQKRDKMYTNLASFKIGRECVIYGVKK